VEEAIMTRSSRRPAPPAGIQTEAAPPSPGAQPAASAEPAAETGRLGLGWRIALVVWVLGFLALAAKELVGLVGWKLWP
jgi:hypothetical protein